MHPQGDPDRSDPAAGSLHEEGSSCGSREGCARCRFGGGSTPIDASALEVAAALPLLEFALATTGVEGAAIVQSGAYSAVTRTGTAFAVPAGAIALRLDPRRVVGAVLGEDRGGDPVLELVTGAGRRVHRLRAHAPLDHLVLRGLGRGREGAPPQLPGALLEEWTPAPTAERWSGDDQLSRIDDVLAGDAAGRRSARTPVEHRHIDLRLLPAVLGHLCSTGLPLGAAVFAEGVAQACAGVLQAVSAEEGRLGVVFDDATVDLDSAALGACLLVRTPGVHGPTSALELYDRHGRCVAMLSQFGLVEAAVHGAWEDVAESLPSLG